MLKKSTIPVIVSLLLLTWSSIARAEFNVEQYAYYQEIAVSNIDTYYIELNAPVLNSSREDLADIRLISPQGEEIPYYRETYLAPADTVTPARILQNLNLDYNSRLVVLDSENDHWSHNGLALQLSCDDDFTCDVLIEGSYDNVQYDALAMNRVYGSSGEVSLNELSYPIKNYRYIRLNITGDNASGIGIESAEYVYNPLESQSLALLSAMQVNSFDDSTNNSSNYIIDLGVKNLTIHDVLVQSPLHDFTRLVNIYGSNDGEKWALLTKESRIFDYRWDSFSSRDDSVEVNRNTGRFLKVEILNEDKKELQVQGINVLGMVPRLVAPLNSGTYRLYYGYPGDTAPPYVNQPTAGHDSNKIHPVLDANRPVDNPSYSIPAGYVADNFSSRTVNIILLVCFLAVAAILSRNIIQAVKRNSGRVKPPR